MKEEHRTPLRLLDRLADVRPSGDRRWTARCPAHDDRRASLSLKQTADGTLLVRCHAGCETKAVVEAAGLRLRDLFAPQNQQRRTPPAAGSRSPSESGRSRASHGKAPSRRGRIASRGPNQSHGPTAPTKPKPGFSSVGASGRSPEFVDVYQYRNEQGDVVYEVCRTADKRFLQRRVTPSGCEWGLGDVQPVLYRLPELLAANPDDWVFVVEGEKDVESLRAIGLTATTAPGGAGKWRDEYAVSLTRRRVVILPDNDEPGRRHGEAVASSLSRRAADVRSIELPRLPPKGDVSDWLAAGGTRDDLLQLVSASEPLVDVACDWLLWRAFPVDWLPWPLNRFVREAAVSIGCDESYIALPLLAALAATIGTSRSIRLTADWEEPAVLWTAVVGESGTQKSPAIHAPLKPLYRRERETVEAFEREREQFEQDEQMYKAELAAWRKRHATGTAERPPLAPTAPVCRRLIVADVTIEALAERLAENPRGLLVVRDELAGWLRSFDRYKGRGADTACWLSLHGARELIVDRKSGDRTTLFVSRAAVSITGGIQPEILRQALSAEHLQDGLAARLLLAHPPRRAREWTETAIAAEVLGMLDRIYSGLAVLEPDCDELGRPQPKALPLSDGARARWGEFIREHGIRQLDLDGPLAAAWSKLEAYAARLALIVHLVRVAAGDQTLESHDVVGDDSLLAAITLCRWFGQEAQRMYARFSEDDDARERRELVETIERQGGSVTARQLCRVMRRFGGSVSMVRAALDELAQSGIGQWVERPTSARGGRPTRAFELLRNA